MKVRPLVFLLFASVSPVFGATLPDRVERLETQVSELKNRLHKINRGGSRSNYASRGSSSYVIRSGDSLWKIARTFDVSVSDLENANPGINPRRLLVGKEIRLPRESRTVSTALRNTTVSTTSTPSRPLRNTSTYQVKNGDILGHIAEDHGVRLQDLMKANPSLDPRLLKVGTIVNIPGHGTTSSTSRPSTRKAAPAAAHCDEETQTRPTREVVAARAPATQGVQPRPNPYVTTKEPEVSRLSNYYDSPAKPRLVPISRDSRLSEIAQLHRTTVATINQLNDVNLSPEQMIRSGSQLYVPSR